MTIVDDSIKSSVDDIFPGAILEVDPLDRKLNIRTDFWLIESEQLNSLRLLGLNLDSIMVEGGWITLIIDKETSKKAIKH